MECLAGIAVADGKPSAARRIARDAGDTVQTYEYSVYGEPAAADPNHPNPFLFTARRFDTETGLYHYRARAYNPYIGRFLQTDPANSGMNAYAYCGNCPVNMIDPLGLEHYNVFYGQHGNTISLWWELTEKWGAWDVAGLWSLFGGTGKVLVSKTFYPIDYPLDDDTITVYTLIDASSEGWEFSIKQPCAYSIVDLGAFLGKFMNSTTLKGYFLTELTRALENTSGWEVVKAPGASSAVGASAGGGLPSLSSTTTVSSGGGRRRGWERPWWVDPVNGAAAAGGWASDVYAMTDGYRGPAGIVLGVVGGTLVVGPIVAGYTAPVWVPQLGVGLAAIGGIVGASDLVPTDAFVHRVVAPIRQNRQHLQVLIDQNPYSAPQ